MRKTNWKKRAWTEFSRYIKLRDCLEGTGDPDIGICCSCQTRIPRKGNHAGHFIPHGGGNSVYLHEENVHLQCVQCNYHKSGNYVEYYQFMLNRYGPEKIDELRILGKQKKPMVAYEWEALCKHYKEKADGLMTI